MNSLFKTAATTASAAAMEPGDTAAFICRDNDAIWIGIERGIDNGFGCVFVTDADGKLVGRADMADMRKAIAKGAHLGRTCLGELTRPFDSGNLSASVLPVFD